ncbi:PREDICTED: eukaryotic translation initiation factor 5B-like [Acropora digitifera]|uniref:eukaryotic translation initiation factor 5B-like n=1 Tax=Acropora digitifera TaxID=70779 RepID=UPI00077B21F4|nr:PREDICTED: eukaryotic translation initiation factor 5B-like [Acropora digitifera]
MAEEAPTLKRDTTMTVTVKEGEAFLEEHPKVHGEAKTRAQQKEIEESEEDASIKVKRTSTMAATAQEGSDLLGDEERGKTRSETAAKNTEDNKEEDKNIEENGDCEENGAEKPAVKRDGTMVVTASEGEKFLEEAGHTIDGGTRGEVEAIKTALKESEADEENRNEDVEKPDLKRKGTMQETIEEGEEFLKKQKTSNGADHQEEVEAQ